MLEYLKLLQVDLAAEIQATREYAATIAIAPQSDIPVILEILADETDHISKIATLASKMSGSDADYSAMVPGVS